MYGSIPLNETSIVAGRTREIDARVEVRVDSGRRRRGAGRRRRLCGWGRRRAGWRCCEGDCDPRLHSHAEA